MDSASIMAQQMTTSSPSVTASVNQQMHQQSQSQNQMANEHISKVRQLVWSLKDSLSNLMQVTALNINHNCQIDSGMKTTEDKVARFDKALEEFFASCNQIELLLKTINECAIQHRDSQKYLQFNVSTLKSDASGIIENCGPETVISYSQYISTIKNQIHYAKSVQEVLIEGAKRVTQNEPPVNAAMSNSTAS